MVVTATLNGAADGGVLIVTTTVGNEVIPCYGSGNGPGVCAGTLIGDPLIGGRVLMAVGGSMLANGRIAQVK